MQNPDLAAASAVAQAAALAVNTAGADIAAVQNLAVLPTKALTPPMEQHEASGYAYFRCSLPTASLHRPDGKKLPFVRGLLKSKIQEDIDYLRNEIKQENAYIEEVKDESGIEAIEATLNPREALKNSVMKEVSAEIGNILAAERSKMEAEIRAKLLAEMATGSSDAGKIAGVDGGDVNAVMNSAQQTGQVQVVHLNPQNSSHIAEAAAGGASTAAARAAAALAAANTAGKK